MLQLTGVTQFSLTQIHNSSISISTDSLLSFNDARPLFFVACLTGRVRRSGIALLPLLPPHPPSPLILRHSEAKNTWGKGWSTLRRASATHAIHRGTTLALGTEALEIMRAMAWREAEAVDL